MREHPEVLLEAIRCELLCVQQRLETRESSADGSAAGDVASPVPLVAGAADVRVGPATEVRRDREVAIAVIAEVASPGPQRGRDGSRRARAGDATRPD